MKPAILFAALILNPCQRIEDKRQEYILDQWVARRDRQLDDLVKNMDTTDDTEETTDDDQ